MTTDVNPNTPAKLELKKPLPSPRVLRDFMAVPDRAQELDALLRDSGVDRERFISTVVHALVKAPDVLEKCSAESVIMATLDAAKMGLEPTGQYGGAYLIRRGNVAVMEVDYRGFIRMAQRSGAIKRAMASAVYHGDEFEWEEGTNPYLKHRPTQGPARGEPERGDLTHVYAIGWLPDGTPQFRVMTRDEVNAIMARTSSKKDGKVVGPWVTDYVPMALKTVVRNLFKWMPAVYNPALRYALEREDELTPLTNETHSEGAPRVTTRRDMILAGLSGETAPEEPQEQPAEETPADAPEEKPPANPEELSPAEEAAIDAAEEEAKPKRRRPARQG